MAADGQIESVIEVPAGHATAEGAHAPNLVDVSPTLTALTWIAFLLLAWVLHRVAWKPILAALDQRERGIRRALDGAEAARKETAALQEHSARIVREAEEQARQALADARAAATQTAAQIQAQAQAGAQDLVQSARREIAAATEQARRQLRQETAGLAVAMAEKVVRHSLSPEAGRELADKLAGEL